MKNILLASVMLFFGMTFGSIINSSVSARQIMIVSDEGVPLPEGVVAVEYIESTDPSQYIDIGYVIKSDKEICSVSYMRTNSDGYAFAGIGRYGNGMNFYLYSGNGCDVSYGRTVYNVWDGNLGGVNEIVKVTFGNGLAVARNINRDYSITKEIGQYDFSGNMRSFWLFKSNGAAEFATPIGLRFIGAEIELNGNELCNIIPVRTMNNRGEFIGAVYDIVRSELFTNSGSGDFIIGPDK